MSTKRPGGSFNGGGRRGGGSSFIGEGRRGGGSIGRIFTGSQGGGRGLGNSIGGCTSKGSRGGGKLFGNSGGRVRGGERRGNSNGCGGSNGGCDGFLSFSGGHNRFLNLSGGRDGGGNNECGDRFLSLSGGRDGGGNNECGDRFLSLSGGRDGGGNNEGGDRFLSFSDGRDGDGNSEGGDRFCSFGGGRASGGSNHSGVGRKGGSGGSQRGGGRNDGRSMSGRDGGGNSEGGDRVYSSGGGRASGGSCHSGVGRKDGSGGSQRGGGRIDGRSMSGRDGGGNSEGGDRVHSSGGGRASGGSSHSGVGRKDGSGGSQRGGGRIDGGSMSVRGNERDHEQQLRNDNLNDAGFEDSEEDDHYDDGDASGNSDDELEDYDGEDGEGSDGSGTDTDDGDDIFYSRQGFSLGTYAKVPDQPLPIRMAKKVIDNPTATRTLLALMRIYWPVGCVLTKDIDKFCPYWWRLIRKKFFRYYTYDSRYGTEQDARRAVSYHMHENIRKTQANERKRVQLLIKDKGGSFLDHIPSYFSEAVWKVFCEYWDSPEFQKKSKAAKDNRKKQENQHRSGATSFRRHAWDILDETGKEPGECHLFLKTHTDKNGVFSSEAVGAMMERYIELCQMQNVDPNDAPIHIWAKAVGVRKNCITGVPRTKASDIILIKRSRKCRRYQDDESGASTNDRSLHMADESVIRMVDQTVAYARVHPEKFHLALEQVLMLEKSVSVAEGDGELSSDHPLSIGTMTELVRVMVSVLTDIQANQKSDKNEGKGKSVMHEDGSSFDMDDTRHLPHSPQLDQHSTGGD